MGEIEKLLRYDSRRKNSFVFQSRVNNHSNNGTIARQSAIINKLNNSKVTETQIIGILLCHWNQQEEEKSDGQIPTHGVSINYNKRSSSEPQKNNCEATEPNPGLVHVLLILLKEATAK